MSPTSAVIDSGVLVFREGLETILALAAITASFLGANRAYRKPVAAGGVLALAAAVGTWFAAVWLIGMFGHGGLVRAGGHRHPRDHRAAARHELVLPQALLDRLDLPPPQAQARPARARASRTGPSAPCCSGSACSASPRSIARALRSSSSCRACASASAPASCSRASSSACCSPPRSGVLTFALHQRLPYRKLLVITGAMLRARCCG